MKIATVPWSKGWVVWVGAGVVLLASAVTGGMVRAVAQDAGTKGQTTAAKPQSAAKGTDDQVVGEEEELPPATLPPASATAELRGAAAWKMLADALEDDKHPQTRIEALAALGLLRNQRCEKMIESAMGDPDVDVRTAAALAAGQTKDRNLTTPLRNLLDDKEPEVVFTAATTLWKMNDRSGEDILMAVVDGDRKAEPTVMHGAEHKIDKDLHDPAMLAKMGAMQGVSMMLGPFGYGLTAYQFMKQSGGNSARVTAIEELAQERTEPIHKELVAALGDKDVTVRAAAAKALVDYHDKPTQMAVYALLADNKQPVRLTAAAAYLRTMGVAGPPVVKPPMAEHQGKPEGE